MIMADMGVALFAALLALLFLFGVALPWHIYVILFVRAFGDSIHQSAMLASTTLMVPKKHLTRIGGMNQTMQGLRNIAGPARVQGIRIISMS
jgi:DHA3 family macrolide efflux protein-like MFS transporter